MERHAVDSQALRSLGYESTTGLLELEFSSGHVYRYEAVPASVVEWLERSRNKGRYVQHHLAGRYGETRVERPGPVPTSDGDLEATLLASLRPRPSKPPPKE